MANLGEKKNCQAINKDAFSDVKRNQQRQQKVVSRQKSCSSLIKIRYYFGFCFKTTFSQGFKLTVV